MAQLGFTLRSDSRSVCRENRLKTRVPKSQRLKKVAKRIRRGQSREEEGGTAPGQEGDPQPAGQDWSGGEELAGPCLHGRPWGLKAAEWV